MTTAPVSGIRVPRRLSRPGWPDDTGGPKWPDGSKIRIRDDRITLMLGIFAGGISGIYAAIFVWAALSGFLGQWLDLWPAFSFPFVLALSAITFRQRYLEKEAHKAHNAQHLVPSSPETT